MNDLRRATASLLAVSDSDELVPMPQVSISLAEFNNLLFKIASYDGFEGTTLDDFAKAFAAALNGNAVIEAVAGVENFPETGEDGALYLDTETGKIYYYEDGEYKQANADTEITEQEIIDIIKGILGDDSEKTEDLIKNAVKDYLKENDGKDMIGDIIDNYLDENKDDIASEIADYLNKNPDAINDGILDYLKNEKGDEISQVVKDELGKNPELLENGIEQYLKENENALTDSIDKFIDENQDLINEMIKEKIDADEDIIKDATKDYLKDNEYLINSGVDVYLDENKDVVKDGVKEYLKQNKDELNDLIFEHYEVETDDSTGNSDLDIIEEKLKNVKSTAGDIFVIKHLITDDKYDYTSYYYNGENWCAMSGNYNAKNVYFGQDFIITEPIGAIQDFSGKTTLLAKGKNLVQLLETIFANEKNPSITNPSITITNSTAKNYEVGSIVKPTWVAKFNAGKYEYNDTTGVELKKWEIVNDITGEKSSSASGKFNDIEVTDDLKLTITATATYTDGDIPLTNIDNPIKELAIKAGSVSKTSAPLKGYRKTFFGITMDNEELTSDSIRELESSTSGMKDGSVFSINVGEGAARVVIAYPANLGNISSVKKDGTYEIADKFEMTTMEIEGANGYKPIEYKVYTRAFDKEREADCIYNVII